MLLSSTTHADEKAKAAAIAATHPPGEIASDEHFRSPHVAIVDPSDPPWVATFAILSLNDTFTFNGLEPGYKAMFTYSFTPNFYTQNYFLTLRDNNYEINTLWGVQASHGNFQPYLEVDTSMFFYRHARVQMEGFYDAGINIMLFKRVIPIIEFDNFFEKNRIAFTPQIIFQITKRFSIEFEYYWTFKTGTNSLELRFNYAF